MNSLRRSKNENETAIKYTTKHTRRTQSLMITQSIRWANMNKSWLIGSRVRSARGVLLVKHVSLALMSTEPVGCWLRLLSLSASLYALKRLSVGSFSVFTIRYDTRCYFNVRSKADISQLNLPHGTDSLNSFTLLFYLPFIGPAFYSFIFSVPYNFMASVKLLLAKIHLPSQYVIYAVFR